MQRDTARAPEAPRTYTGRVIRALALTSLVVALALLLWNAVDVVLLSVVAILLAVALATPAAAIARGTRMPHWLALLLIVLAIVTAVGAGLWIAGEQIVAQLTGLVEDLPRILERLQEALVAIPGGERLLEGLAPAEDDVAGLADLGMLAQAAGALGTMFETLIRIAFVVFLALFLAAAPGRYRDGMVRLAPPSAQPRTREVLDQLGTTIQGWILGQLASMLLVGILATVGLLLIGVPYALLLGVVAGLAELIPIFGPIFAYLPAVIVAFVEGPQQALWVTLLYLVIQQLEGNVIQPVVQRFAADLPKALTVVAVLLGGALFGPIGLFVATPLMAVGLTLVKMLYLHDALGQHVELPGGTEES